MSEQKPETQGIECILAANGYKVIFRLFSLDDESYIHYQLRFLLNSDLAVVDLGSVATTIAMKDLERLLTYLEDHMVKPAKSRDESGEYLVEGIEESFTFVEWELGFQLQALAGDRTDDGDGECSISFMVNVGRSTSDEDFLGTYVYVGGKSDISFANMRAFIGDTRTAISKLQATA